MNIKRTHAAGAQLASRAYPGSSLSPDLNFPPVCLTALAVDDPQAWQRPDLFGPLPPTEEQVRAHLKTLRPRQRALLGWSTPVLWPCAKVTWEPSHTLVDYDREHVLWDNARGSPLDEYGMATGHPFASLSLVS
jgi:hypothetical protein